MGNKPEWWESKAGRKRQNRRSGALERSVAKKTGGKVQPGSGSSWRARGDVKTSTHLIEHKFTEKGSFSVKLSTLQNLNTIARDGGKQPALIIHYGATEQSPAFVITPYQD